MEPNVVFREVDFHGDNLLCAKDSEVYTAINYILNGIGFNEKQIEYQRNKWMNDEIISKGIQKYPYPSAGGVQDTYCISLRKLPYRQSRRRE